MRNLVIFFLLGTVLAPTSLNARQDAKSFVDRYRNQDGFTVVNVEKQAMGIMSQFGMTDVFGNADAVQALIFFRPRDIARSNAFKREALNFVETSRYEELIEVAGVNDTAKIFGKSNGEVITEIIILNRSNRDAFVEMICVSGKFTLNDVMSLSGITDNNIAKNQ